MLRIVGWLMIFIGFGLFFPRKHWVIGPSMMAVGALLALV